MIKRSVRAALACLSATRLPTTVGNG